MAEQCEKVWDLIRGRNGDGYGAWLLISSSETRYCNRLDLAGCVERPGTFPEGGKLGPVGDDSSRS